MQKTRVIAVPAKGGVPVVIRCTQVSSRMSIQEDGSANAGVQQGLIYSLLTPTGAAAADAWEVGPAVQVPPSESLEPILVAGYPGDHPPNTVPIGNGGSSPYPVCPGGPVTLGTPVVQVTSASDNATTIDVTEN
jgi:hypothetical protein